MMRSISTIRIFFALALVAGAAACDSASELTAPVERADAPSYIFQPGTSSSWIGPDGGYLEEGDTYIVVRPGTVSEPTLFTLELVGDCDTPREEGIGVLLTATVNGQPVTEFVKDIYLSVSYECTYFEDLHPRDQHNLRLINNHSPDEALSGGANVGQKRVWGWTDHFSEFIIGDL